MVDTILASDNPQFVINANLDNTLYQAHSLADNLSGRYGINENVTTVDYQSNAAVSFSTGYVVDQEVHEVVLGRPTRKTTLSRPFTQPTRATSFGSVKLHTDRTDDNLKFRKFKGAKIQVQAGERLANIANYQDYIQGKFGNYTYNNKEISLNVIPDSDELSKPYPPAVFTTGPSKGRARPIISGSVKGFSPLPDSENSDGSSTGVYLFTDNGVDTSDPVAPYLEAFEWSESNKYYPTDLLTLGGYLAGSGGYTALTDSEFSFTVANNIATSANTIGCRVSVDSDDVTVAANNGEITISRNSVSEDAFDSSDFDWQIESVNRAVSNKDISAVAVTTGDVEIFEVGQRWFKIRANGTGNVNIEFPRVVKSAKMVVRAIRDSFQQVSNFAPVQDSTTPDFFTDPASPNYNTDVNHLLTYTNHGGTSFSFDYTSTDNGFLCAIWFEEIVFADLLPIRVTCSFLDNFLLDPRNVYQPDLNFSVPAGLNEFTGWPNTGVVSPTNGATTLVDLGNIETSEIGFSVNLDNSFSFTIDSIQADLTNIYGADISGDTFILRPPPNAQRDIGFDTQVRIMDLGTGTSPDFGLFRISGSAAITSSDTEKAKFFIEANSSPEILEAQQIPRSFDVVVSSDSTPKRISIGTWRGNFDTKGGYTAVNDDVDFSIEFSNVVISPVSTEETITVFNQNQGELEKLSVFRVDDARVYKNKVPPRCAVYDSNGYLAVSNRYSDVFGDFVGNNSIIDSVSAMQEISNLATGADQITTTVTGDTCGFVVTEQGPWLDVVKRLAHSFDYFVYDNLATTGATLIDRWKFDFNQSDFDEIVSDDFVLNSVSRIGDHEREYQYEVEYQPDLRDSRRSKFEKSEVGYVGDKDKKLIVSYFINQAKNQELAGLINRDSNYNDLFKGQLVNQGWGLTVGMVGNITHPDIPPAYKSEIYEVSENQNGNTDIIFKVYR